MTTRAEIDEFLAQPNIAVVGVSKDEKHFANALYKDLKGKGYHVVPVGASAERVDGDTSYHSLADVPEEVGGAIVMVNAERAMPALEDCARAHVPRVWLFKAFGPGALSDENVRYCRDHGMRVVDGCPLMFADPVKGPHAFHRFCRRVTGRLPR